MIKRGSKVKFFYELRVDGKKIDSGRAEYVQGEGDIFPALEEEMEKMNEGERKIITLPPEKAFGEWSEEAVKRIPLSLFYKPEEIPSEGPMEIQDEKGRVYSVQVKEKGNDYVILDFNHPLAGKTLTFEVEIIKVEEP